MADLVAVDQTFRTRYLTRTFAKPRLIALLRSYLRALNDIETTAAALPEGMISINAALTAQLLVLARIVGAPIYTGQDELTRISVRAEILARRSRGTLPDLLQVFDVLFPNVDPELVEYFPASILAGPVYETSTDVARVVGSVLRRARPAGVRLDLLYSPLPEAQTFRFATGTIPEADAERGFGEATDPSDGGGLAGLA